MAMYLNLALAATLLVICEAGLYKSPRPSASAHYYYRNRDIANDPGYYYQNRDANQQGYYYQNSRDRDANQQGYYYQNSRDRDANQQGYYYQNNRDIYRDANQQGYYYQNSQDRDANRQGYYYQDRDANQQGYYYGYYYRYKDANQQQASSCMLQIEPPSKTFTICVRPDEVCTNISVPACTSSATNCQQISNELLEIFKQINPDVYAQECTETTGGYCLYTDVTYGTCSSAQAMEDKFCVKLSDGTERCTELENLAKAAGLKDGNLPSKP